MQVSCRVVNNIILVSKVTADDTASCLVQIGQDKKLETFGIGKFGLGRVSFTDSKCLLCLKLLYLMCGSLCIMWSRETMLAHMDNTSHSLLNCQISLRNYF